MASAESSVSHPHNGSVTRPAPLNIGVKFDAVLQEPSPDYDESSRNKGKGREPNGGLAINEFEDAVATPKCLAPPDARRNSSTDPPALLTPAGRRSVQFARNLSEEPESSPLPENESPSRQGEATTSGAAKGRRAPPPPSLFSRLRAFASSSNFTSHARSPSGYTIGGESIDERFDIFTPGSEEQENRTESPNTYGENSDADAEHSGSDSAEAGPSNRRKRKSRRPRETGVQTAPTTPKRLFNRNERPSLPHSHSDTEKPVRSRFFERRSTAPALQSDRQVMSEDEGRSRLEQDSTPRRTHGLRGMSQGMLRKMNQHSGAVSGDSSRPGTFRRAFTGFAGSGDVGAGGDQSTVVSPWKLRGERTASVSAARWRQLKAGLKMIGRQRKQEAAIDHAKSAELLAELTAGVPAVFILASMFQRDEHGNRRIPILLEQLKVRIADSRNIDSRSGDRHMLFRIELEYGNGLTRMKWTIHRTLRDFTNLHAKYKFQVSAQRYVRLMSDESRVKMPHFPRSAFPYLRGIRGPGVSDSEGEDDGDNTGPSGTDGSEGQGARGKAKKKRPSLGPIRRASSVADASILPTTSTPPGESENLPRTPATRRELYPERQRRKLELYLQQMIRFLMFRPESNRLCKFFELSALGIRLAAEGSYHGKEGFLVIKSGKGVDFRRAWTPSLVKARHGPKWFVVRHSYLVCVDSPEEMNIYDVFLVDSDFRIQAKRARIPLKEKNTKEIAITAKESAANPKQHHSLKIHNAERKLKLLAKHERQMNQFEESIKQMITTTPWALKNRFDSFAPVRKNVFAQWLVDGRDYMWNVSRAISMAKDVIYIHDWWLSPELYMRRPAAISKKWRLDRLLQQKARQGVKVFVIVYRNINSAIPIDSEYSKFSLLDLHPNVFVQRSPNQIRQNTFFWAHHEKLCLVDHMIAFIGGIDLCFGRWDTPQHTVVDDKLTGFEESNFPKDADHCQLWPGKDYSNPRVQDFYALDKPYEEMYDRSKVPRMPWHDIAMQIVGQPARDLTRHFVQRWNYILRQRKPTRPTPFLLPPPDFNQSDLEALGLQGTCEVQVLRSCGMWSMGTPDRVEHSILNAYVKMIEQSDHFVYIENQFFVSSCEVEGTRIENSIGDALVQRILKASRNDEAWRAVIIIPLMPGFQNTVDSQDGTSVRLIMQCQYRSICRGELSIFQRLRTSGVEPGDYIQFYGLRSWGQIGPTKALVSEQLYIHAKCMVVDDRIAIIGSANINERSMLGNRDSECAAVVRDSDMIWSTMSGQPYLVGRFPHSLRIRLMREHLGLDVDEVMEEERREILKRTSENRSDYFATEHTNVVGEGSHRSSHQGRPFTSVEERREITRRLQKDIVAQNEELFSYNHDANETQKNNPHLASGRRKTTDPRVIGNEAHRKDVEGEGFDRMKDDQPHKPAARNTKTNGGSVDGSEPMSRGETSASVAESFNGSFQGYIGLPPMAAFATSPSELEFPMLSQLPPLPKSDDTDIGGPPAPQLFRRDSRSKATSVIDHVLASLKQAEVEKDCMRDPLDDDFYTNIWHAVAENNTNLFRAVFRCMPDNEVKTWKEYKEYAVYGERFKQAQDGPIIASAKPQRPANAQRERSNTSNISGPPGAGTVTIPDVNSSEKKQAAAAQIINEKLADTHSMAKGGVKAVKEKLADSRENRKHPIVGDAEDWASDAARHNAEAAERANARSKQEPQQHLDEKAALRVANDASRDFVHPVATHTDGQVDSRMASKEAVPKLGHTGSRRRRRTTVTRGGGSLIKEFKASDDMMDRSDALDLMRLVQGHLVIWPHDWLVKEEQGGNWLYSIDQLAPLEIYN